MNPVSLVAALTQNIIANWADIIAQANALYKDYGYGAWFDAGKDCAKILTDSVGTISPPSTLKMGGLL